MGIVDWVGSIIAVIVTTYAAFRIKRNAIIQKQYEKQVKVSFHEWLSQFDDPETHD